MKRRFSECLTRKFKPKLVLIKLFRNISTLLYLNFLSKWFYNVLIKRYSAFKLRFYSFWKINETSTLKLNIFGLVADVVDRSHPVTFAGSRPSRGTIKQIHALRRLIEAVDIQQLELVITIVDFEKAIDLINRRVMFSILRQ